MRVSLISIFFILLISSQALEITPAKVPAKELNKMSIWELLASVIYHLINPDMDVPVSHNPNAENKHRFMVIGDFGNILNYYYLNKVAGIMNTLSNNEPYSHIITVGDNFYLNGIRYIWFRAIPWLVMTVFKKNAIKDLPFYPVLGNHDCYGDMYNELKFSKYDSQWEFHEDYYTIKSPLPDNPNKYFVNLMLNTCKLYCPDKTMEGEAKECLKYGIEAGGPEVQAQYQWLEDQLREHSSDSSVSWLAVTLHHPVFTKPALKQYLLPLLRKYDVDIIFVGHEHWCEYSNMANNYEIRFPNSGYGDVLWDCKKEREILNHDQRSQGFRKGDHIHYFLVGNGGANFRDQDGEVYLRNTQNYGMMDVQVDSQSFTARFLEVANNEDGYKEIYQVNILQ